MKIKGSLTKWESEKQRGRPPGGVVPMSITGIVLTDPSRIVNRKETSVVGPNRKPRMLHFLQEIYPSNLANGNVSSL